MRKILIIDSSPNVASSVSRALTRRFAEAWVAAHPGDAVAHRDVGVAPPPHLDAATLAAWFTPPEKRDPEAARAVALSDALIDELVDADLVVIGAPMHNFGVSSGLKTWIDHIARAGRTFRYTAEGPVGLVSDKPVYVISTRGGRYAEGSGNEGADFHEGQLRQVLRLIGIAEPTVIRAEGVAIDPETARAAIDAAERQIDAVVAGWVDARAA
jgi:FMN-dependent NADH-azoreductase